MGVGGKLAVESRASQSEGSRNSPSPFVLWKLEISTSLMGHSIPKQISTPEQIYPTLPHYPGVSQIQTISHTGHQISLMLRKMHEIFVYTLILANF